MDSISNHVVSTDTAIDIVNSPDDGGWYVQETQLSKPYNSRTSRKIFRSADDAKRAFRDGAIKWSKWS